MVVMDEYSRFPIVDIIHSLSAKNVIPHLDKIFSLFRCPVTLKTDNGPPMNSSRNLVNTLALRIGK